MIVYGREPNLTKRDGMPYGTLMNRMAFIFGRDIIGSKFVVGSDEPVVNTTKTIEVVVPPYVSKYNLQLRLGQKRSFDNSVCVYEYGEL